MSDLVSNEGGTVRSMEESDGLGSLMYFVRDLTTSSSSSVGVFRAVSTEV